MLRSSNGATRIMITRRCAVATLSDTEAARSPIGHMVTTRSAMSAYRARAPLSARDLTSADNERHRDVTTVVTHPARCQSKGSNVAMP